MPRYILGISESHCSTAALLADGSLASCVSEERFSRTKNTAGFPHQAVKYCLEQAGIKASELEAIVFANESPTNHFFYGGGEVQAGGSGLLKRVAEGVMGSRLVDIRPLKRLADRAAKLLFFGKMRARQIEDVRSWLGVEHARVRFVEHHAAHAWSAAYFLPKGAEQESWTLLTLDGLGDELAATVSRLKGNKLERIASTDYFDSLGLLYAAFTRYLGMKANEHEYKVMGLAPYADENLVKKGAAILRPYFRQEGLGFHIGISLQHPLRDLHRLFDGLRFDGVSGAIQRVTEENMLSWASAAIKATGSAKVAASGGCFMNVKANMLLRESSGASALVLCPSAGDESNAIGAAYGYFRLNGGEVNEARQRALYLGPANSAESVLAAVAKPGWKGKYKATPITDPAQVGAELLAKGEVVSTMLGRMEFGARSLGNRSILAHPGRPELVKVINHAIKMRDFWMPFAGTVLDRRAADYLESGSALDAPYMMTAYDTKEKAHTELAAAIHPFDHTMRPQVLEKHMNPTYYGLIEAFEKLTGIGGVLNTSFNLHGEPVVCSPEDAIHTLDESGLKYLLTDTLLVEKTA